MQFERYRAFREVERAVRWVEGASEGLSGSQEGQAGDHEVRGKLRMLVRHLGWQRAFIKVIQAVRKVEGIQGDWAG